MRRAAVLADRSRGALQPQAENELFRGLWREDIGEGLERVRSALPQRDEVEGAPSAQRVLGLARVLDDAQVLAAERERDVDDLGVSRLRAYCRQIGESDFRHDGLGTAFDDGRGVPVGQAQFSCDSH